jgi:hypothetical protein
VSGCPDWGQAVPKHEQYEELCTLAMIGEVSADELRDLRQHLVECTDCRHEYQEFVQLVLPQLSVSDESISPVSNSSRDNTQALRARFLERAQAAGISFSATALNPPEDSIDEPAADRGSAPIAMLVRKRPTVTWLYRGSIAAALVAAATAGGFLAVNWHGRFGPPTARNGAASPPEVVASTSNQLPSVSDFSAQLAADSRKITRLETKLGDTNTRLASEQEHAESLMRERAALQQQIDSEKQALAVALEQGQSSQQTVASLQARLSDLQTRADTASANASLDQLKVSELSAQVKDLNVSLDRERDMLSAGRDMRDMMAARSLHIVDVVDTDSKGKTSPAFGRIFFAENRQLVFYAYDLSEKRLEEARYDYRIWGQKEGQPHTARSLGIFYSDDKTQHRWVFKCEDPKVLSEIDSVFVTLEPNTSDPAHPHGPQLMYAYLRGQPNHP